MATEEYIRFQCPACDSRIRAPRRAAGAKLRCPNPVCREAVNVPGRTGSEPAPLEGVSEWEVVTGEAARKIALEGRRVFTTAKPECVLLRHPTSALPGGEDASFRIRARFECILCDGEVVAEGTAIRGSGAFGLFCPGCGIGGVGCFSTLDVPAGSILIWFNEALEFEVVGVVTESGASDPEGASCPVCARGVGEVGKLLQGLCRRCHAASLAGKNLVGRSRFGCDACNREFPCEVGEVFKAPQISGSVFCKRCFPGVPGAL